MDEEKVVSELEWIKSELLKGDKILEYYQAQVDILQRAIQLLKHKTGKDGMVGWVCPICGKGLSPFTYVCPCKSTVTNWEITC